MLILWKRKLVVLEVLSFLELLEYIFFHCPRLVLFIFYSYFLDKDKPIIVDSMEEEKPAETQPEPAPVKKGNFAEMMLKRMGWKGEGHGMLGK